MTVLGQFLRFCAVGGLGFLVDAGLLWLLLDATGLGPYLARVASFLAAATVTWSLHRVFTFPEAPRRHGARQWLLFLVVNGGGAALNYAVYAGLVATTELFAAQPVLAVAVGSAVALTANYAGNRFWVFRHARA